MKISLSTVYPAGRFDKELIIHEGNKMIYELLGEGMFHPLYQLVDMDDRLLLQRMLEECNQQQEHTVTEIVTLVSEEKSTRCILCMRRYPESEDFLLELMETEKVKQYIVRLKEELVQSRDYLSILGSYLFSYSPDNDFFHLFWANHEQDVDLYLGKLATWKEQLYRNGQIASEDRRIFDAFCENLRSAALEQSFTFHGSVLTGGYREDAYRVRFLPRQLLHGEGSLRD